MKKFMQGISDGLETKFLKPSGEKFLGFINKRPELFCLSLLAIMCLVFLFVGLDFYPLIDVDETRYAVMARDLLHSFSWNNLMLNSEPFLEKPPLYFWLVASSIKLFGSFTALIVRLPIALLASFLTFFTYFLGKKVISRKFGVISALILLTSVFFLMLSHVAIIDMVLTVFVTSAMYCGFLTHFSEERYKKYCWWYFYLFVALGFLAKGILALALPVIVIFAYNLATKRVKEIFKPVNILPGIVIFLATALPWHWVMYMEYGNTFIKEYFLIHHFARFIDSAYIGRQQPFWYFIPVFFVGFLPWSFTFIAFLIDGCKKLTAKYKQAQGNVKNKIVAIFDAQTNEQKLILFASIYFVLTFIIFSASSTKLPTYILPVIPAAALLTGYFWWKSDETGEYEKPISVATQILAAVFILGGFVAVFVCLFLPYDIQSKIETFRAAAINGIILAGVLMLLRLNTKRALSIFYAYILTMLFVVAVLVSSIFNLIYQGGENEIVSYSAYANSGTSQLVTFDFAVKPSAMIKYEDKVQFVTDPDFNKLDELTKFRLGPTFVIVKNKNMEDAQYAKKINDRLELLNAGDRYSLYVKDVNNEFNNEPIVDEEVIYSRFKGAFVPAKSIQKSMPNTAK